MLKGFKKAFLLLLFLLTVNFALAATSNAAEDPSRHLGSLDFCGEKVPLNDGPTYEAVDQSLVLLAEARSRVFLGLKRAGRFLPTVENVLSQNSLPRDLKYIPYALTGFSPTHNSGGRGIWKISESYGRQMGLRIDSQIDERLDPVKSSNAAAIRLKSLYNTYGSWTSAAAAFVIGEADFSKAASDAGGGKNYYALYFPNGQDLNFAMVLAGKIVFGSPSSFGYSLSGSAWPALSGKRGVVNQTTTLSALASQYGLDYKSFGDLNPHVLTNTVPSGTELNLP